MKFNQCFTLSSICTRNRAILLTGMVPSRNGVHANHSGLLDGVTSLPNYMKELGYRACIANQDGVRKRSDLYEWEYRITESDQSALVPRTPGANGTAPAGFINWKDSSRPMSHVRFA